MANLSKYNEACCSGFSYPNMFLLLWCFRSQILGRKYWQRWMICLKNDIN